MNEPVRVLIVDDHPIVRQGIRAVLEDEGFHILGEAGSGDEALARLGSRCPTDVPEVVLIDLVMPGLPAIEAIRRIRQASPSTQVLVLTTFLEDRQVQEALEAGAIGFLRLASGAGSNWPLADSVNWVDITDMGCQQGRR